MPQSRSHKRQYVNIDDVADVDISNVLSIDYENKRRKATNAEFSNALREMQRVRDAFYATQEAQLPIDVTAGLINYYLEFMRWLKGQSQTSNWIAMPPYGTVDPSTSESDFVNGWYPNFRNAFFTNSTLLNFYLSETKLRRSPQYQALENAAEKKQQEISDKLEDIKKTFEDEQARTHAERMNEFVASVALHDWQEYYDVLLSQSSTAKRGPRFIRKGDGRSYYYDMRHYDFWRSAWLVSFVVAFGISVLVCFLLGWDLHNHLVEVLSMKLIVAILFGSLYVSANKNYRIYANLYDQTRFRAVTTKVLQGIILDNRIQDKVALLTVAAQTLFEMKVSGHLTKKDSGTPTTDLLFSLIGKGSA